MPHVILAGPITPEDVWLAFEPTDFIDKGTRFKAEAAYLAADKSELLIRSLTIERGFRKNFFVRMTKKPEGLSISLEHLASPDRSEGVKRLIGLYAWKILQIDPQISVAATNLTEYLHEPTP